MTQELKTEPYDRSKIFREAWRNARHVETLIDVPAIKLMSASLKTGWLIEKRRREPDRMMSQLAAVLDKIDALANLRFTGEEMKNV